MEIDIKMKKKKPAEMLLDLTNDANIVFFKDQYKIPHTLITIGEHTEILRVESNAFRRYLTKLYYDSEGKVIGSETIQNVTNVLQAKAEYEGVTYPLSLRVAWHNDGSIYYDMTDDKWQCVRISKNGWELLDKTPIPMFTRYKQTQQAEPDRNYQEDILDRFLQLTNLKEEEDKILLSVYIITLFIPDIPHTISQIHGEKGSAKSTLQTFIKILVDPAKPRLLTIYNDTKEFIQQLAHNYVAFYDNMKYNPRWLSDEACKAVTGVGSTKRKLYSDDDDIVYEYRRCLGFNGINLGLTEPDILDRSMMIELQRIRREYTKQDSEIMAEFLELRPKLLGFVFDTLVKALEIKPTIKLNDLPRMADFAIWGEAIARAMGYKELQFINAYYDNIGKQNIEAIENSPLSQAISKFVRIGEDQNREGNTSSGVPCSWQGPMSNALEHLNAIALENNIDTSKSWPKAPNSLSRKLKPLLSNLREGLDINVTIIRNTAGNRKVRGMYFLRVSQVSSPSSPSSPDQNHSQNEGQNGEDTFSGGDTYLHQDGISSPKYTENHAQNPKGEDSEGSEDICDNEGVLITLDSDSDCNNSIQLMREGSSSKKDKMDMDKSEEFKCYHKNCDFGRRRRARI